MKIRIEKPENWDEYYGLRWLVLRKPWRQPKGSEKDDMEKKSVHRAAFIGNKMVGVARLHFNGIKEAQIRYMAVHPDYRRMGIGSRLLEELEKIARKKKAEYIILNARENAVNFYLKNGYSIIGKSYVLYGTIQHYKMIKLL